MALGLPTLRTNYVASGMSVTMVPLLSLDDQCDATMDWNTHAVMGPVGE
jgi:hypothetical protein